MYFYATKVGGKIKTVKNKQPNEEQWSMTRIPTFGNARES